MQLLDASQQPVQDEVRLLRLPAIEVAIDSLLEQAQSASFVAR